jgi:hypothetical protein
MARSLYRFGLHLGARTHEYCRPEWIKRPIDFFVKGGRRAGNHICRLLSTELWLKRCLGTTVLQRI